MAKSAWIKHVAAFRAAHKGMDPKKVFGEAAKTFKKQSGGSALSSLNPSPFHSSPKHASVPTDLDTQVATQYGGGKSKKSRSKKSRKSRSKKSKSHKRRH